MKTTLCCECNVHETTINIEIYGNAMLQSMPILISKCSVVFVVELLHERSSQFGGAKAWIKVKFTSLDDKRVMKLVAFYWSMPCMSLLLAQPI